MNQSVVGTVITQERAADLIEFHGVRHSHKVGMTLVTFLQGEANDEQIILVQDPTGEMLQLQ